MLRVAVLTRRSPASYYLVNRLLAEGVTVSVIFEEPSFKSKLAVLKRRVSRIGLRHVGDQLLLLMFTWLMERRKDKENAKNIFYDQPSGYLVQKDVVKLTVENINDAELKDFLSSESPDILLVNGTSIIKPKIIELLPERIINIHVGVTPEYRGAHGGFWALYNQEPEMLGVTVHLIDSGIDTGAILFQEKVVVDSNDTLRSIVYKQQKTGVDLIFKCLSEFEKGKLHGYYKSNSPSKSYYSPGLTHYFKVKRQYKNILI